MSYAICNVIYGIPLYSENNQERSDIIEEVINNESNGFNRLYSGGSDVDPAYFGITIDEFDECNHHIDLQDINLNPTEENISQVTKLYESLDPLIKNELNLYGEPRVFFLWSSS